MAALTQDRPTPEREGRLVSDPLAANAVVFAGALYVLDADGNATPATAAAANPVRAVALARASQPHGDQRVDGALGVFRFDNDGDAITRADIGSDASRKQYITLTDKTGKLLIEKIEYATMK